MSRESEIVLGGSTGGGTQRFTGSPMPRDELVALLRRLADLVQAGESLEGMVNWLAPELSDPRDAYARVEARYRVGVDGYELVGEWVDEARHVVRHMKPGRSPGFAKKKKEKS